MSQQAAPQQATAQQAPALLDGNLPGQYRPLTAEAEVKMDQCYSCGNRHEHVRCVPYKKANPPFTHFFMCPTNGDPVGVCLAQSGNDHETCIQVSDRIMRTVANWQDQPYLFCMMRFTKDGKIDGQMHRHSLHVDEHNIDNIKFEFDYMLRRCSPLLKPKEPLAEADERILKMFGKQVDEQIVQMAGGSVGSNVRVVPAEAATAVMPGNGEQAGETPPVFGDESGTEPDDDPESDEQ